MQLKQLSLVDQTIYFRKNRVLEKEAFWKADHIIPLRPNANRMLFKDVVMIFIWVLLGINVLLPRLIESCCCTMIRHEQKKFA